jgi:cell division protein FtsB
MANKFTLNKNSQKKDILRYLLPVLILCYILFLVGKSSIGNLNINQEIYKLQSDIEKTKDKNKELEELNIYYQSNSYKEKQARLKLGYAKPGESVIIIPQDDSSKDDSTLVENDNENKTTNLEQPNWKNWINYFFQQ